MSTSVEQHQTELERNCAVWKRKPLLREVYADLYRRVAALIDARLEGRILEIGSGLGALKEHLPEALLSDLFPNPWLDLVADGYRLPFADASLSHLILFDVFHHLSAPGAFMTEARRVLTVGGRLILCEPYISWTSAAVYGLFHHEPIGWRAAISETLESPVKTEYYAAQGNATRIFFRGDHAPILQGWSVVYREAFASMSYLLSGGFSKPAFYPARSLPMIRKLDVWLSRLPRALGARCIVALQAG